MGDQDEVLDARPPWHPPARAQVHNVTALREKITNLEHQLEHALRGAEFWRSAYWDESKRCDEQAKDREDWERLALDTLRENGELLEERDRLHAALEWYARGDNYQLTWIGGSGDRTPVGVDGGTRAREALGR